MTHTNLSSFHNWKTLLLVPELPSLPPQLQTSRNISGSTPSPSNQLELYSVSKQARQWGGRWIVIKNLHFNVVWQTFPLVSVSGLLKHTLIKNTPTSLVYGLNKKRNGKEDTRLHQTTSSPRYPKNPNPGELITPQVVNSWLWLKGGFGWCCRERLPALEWVRHAPEQISSPDRNLLPISGWSNSDGKHIPTNWEVSANWNQPSSCGEGNFNSKITLKYF